MFRRFLYYLFWICFFWGFSNLIEWHFMSKLGWINNFSHKLVRRCKYSDLQFILSGKNIILAWVFPFFGKLIYYSFLHFAQFWWSTGLDFIKNWSRKLHTKNSQVKNSNVVGKKIVLPKSSPFLSRIYFYYLTVQLFAFILSPICLPFSLEFINGAKGWLEGINIEI